MKERKKVAAAMMKDKQGRYARQKLRQQALNILQEHGEPSEANIKTYPARSMEKLCEWKLNKASKKAREELLKAYLDAPVRKKDPEWTMAEEMKLKELLTEDMYAKDTAIGVQLKQTAKATTNNVDDLDDESRKELFQALKDKEGENNGGDHQTGVM